MTQERDRYKQKYESVLQSKYLDMNSSDSEGSETNKEQHAAPVKQQNFEQLYNEQLEVNSELQS